MAMEEAAWDELLRQLRFCQAELMKLRGECYSLTLRNSRPWPENDSRVYVALARVRDDNNYRVSVEVEETQGGPAGEIVVSDKLRNGFAVAYSGSASQVRLTLWVQGRPERKELA